MRSTLVGKQSHLSQKPSLFVKVYMEGIPIGRKLNLMAHYSYDGLVKTLGHMFRTTILCEHFQTLMKSVPSAPSFGPSYLEINFCFFRSKLSATRFWEFSRANLWGSRRGLDDGWRCAVGVSDMHIFSQKLNSWILLLAPFSSVFCLTLFFLLHLIINAGCSWTVWRGWRSRELTDAS